MKYLQGECASTSLLPHVNHNREEQIQNKTTRIGHLECHLLLCIHPCG